MTPFALLGSMEKAAATWSSPQFQQNPYGYQPTPSYNAYAGTNPAGVAGGHQGPQWTAGKDPKDRPGHIDNGLAETAVEMIPGVGSVYLGNKAYHNFKNGEVWRGIGNSAMAALGLIPGVGLVKGIGGGLIKGIKGLFGAGKAVKNTASAAKAVAPAARAAAPMSQGVRGAFHTPAAQRSWTNYGTLNKRYWMPQMATLNRTRCCRPRRPPRSRSSGPDSNSSNRPRACRASISDNK